MPPSIAIRRAGPDDWDAVAAIHSASWRSAYRGIYPDDYLEDEAPAERRAFWRADLAAMDPERDAVFLAEEGGVSSPERGGGPAAGWWRGPASPLLYGRAPSTTGFAGGPPPRSGEERAVGFACLRREGHPAGPLLDCLHVRPDRKGGGIGRRLIAAAAAWLAERQPGAPLQLVVWAGNVAARRFYARLGGREVETFEAPTPGGGAALQVRVRWERAADLVGLGASG